MMVHVYISKNIGRGERMNNVGLAALSSLPFVGFFCVIVRAANVFYLILFKVWAESLAKISYSGQDFITTGLALVD